jgi:hypothetical protein
VDDLKENIRRKIAAIPDTTYPVTQEKSFDLGSADSCESPTVVNLWLETDVFRLRKFFPQLKPYKVSMLPPQHPWHCQGQSFSPEYIRHFCSCFLEGTVPVCDRNTAVSC